MRILIGRNYRTEFDNIFRLLTSRPASLDFGSLGIEALTDAGGTRSISHGDFTYVYDENTENALYEHGADGDNAEFLGFTKTGATWFSKLRGEGATVAANTRWEDFMSKVSQLYHTRYAIVEYCQNKEQRDATARDARSRAASAIKVLTDKKDVTLNGTNFKDVSENSAAADSMDVYILDLRLSVGYGEPKTILGSVYLREDSSSTLRALPHDEAEEIKKIFSNTEQQADNAAQRRASSSFEHARSLHDKALGALKNLVDQNDDNGNFEKYLNFTKDENAQENEGAPSSEDERIIKKLLENTAHDENTLECRKIELLGISHIKWDNRVFEYYDDRGTPLLRFIFSFDGTVSIVCINCGEMIVNNNIFMLKPKGEGKGTPTPKNITDPLSENDKTAIREQVKREHLVTLKCPVGGPAEFCERLRCTSMDANQCFEFKGRSYCEDCDKPEIVCYDDSYRPFPASEAIFSVSDKKMVRRGNNVKDCSICERSYTEAPNAGRTGSGENLCPVCRRAETFRKNGSGASSADIGLYKVYAKSVPLAHRLNRHRRAAFEDTELVMIVIGKKTFKLNKLVPLSAKLITSAKLIKK